MHFVWVEKHPKICKETEFVKLQLSCWGQLQRDIQFLSGSTLVHLWFLSGSTLGPLWFISVPLWFLSGSSPVPLWFLSCSSLVPSSQHSHSYRTKAPDSPSSLIMFWWLFNKSLSFIKNHWVELFIRLQCKESIMHQYINSVTVGVRAHPGGCGGCC